RMALDMADSQYLLILAPSLVIALMFLFFWLFMKETSYDEVLARQKRDLKLPPAKPDTRKKNEKKKNKKKEAGGNGVGGGGGGESEEDLRDFDTSDVTSPTSNEEDSEAVPVSPPVAAPVLAEPTSGIRERKKKEKKPKASPAAVPTLVPLSRTTPTTPPASEEAEVNGSKPAVRKEQPLPLTKQSSPPQPQATPPAPTETTSKKKAKKQKSESEEHPPVVKPDLSPPVVKKVEPVIIEVEIKAKDGAAPVATAAPPTASSGSGRRKKKQKVEPVVTVDEAHVQSSAPVTDSTTSTNHQSNQNNEAPPPAPAPTKHGKKQKSDTNKENSEVKLKELQASLSGLVLSDCDVVSLVSLLRDKSPNALDSWYKTAAKFEPSAQQLAEKDRLLSTLQEEVSITKGKVKQLSQELQAEKQKTGRVESVLHEHRVAREKDIMQVKAQSYQEMQIKFQQFREQLEGQIARLQQENSILRDAVERCSTTNQMENKQSSELNKLHSECNGLMKELAETKNKLQQEELQRKSLEVNYKQNMSQLEVPAKPYISSRNTSYPTVHNALIYCLGQGRHLSRVWNSAYIKQNISFKVYSGSLKDCLKNQRQAVNSGSLISCCILLTNNNSSALLAEKELQRKSLEDSLNAERSSSAGRETKMQAIHNENLTLKTDLQNLQAQISEQAVSVDQLKQSLQQRDDKVRVVENLLESSLIQVANKEAELKAVKNECESLKQQQLEAVQKQTSEQVASLKYFNFDLIRILEKDEKIRSVEESLQSAVDKESERKKAVEDLQQQVETLNTELAQLRSREAQESSSDLNAKLQELHAQYVSLRIMHTFCYVSFFRLAEKDQRLTELQEELLELRESVELHRMKNNEHQTELESTEAECRALLHSFLPHVPLPTEQNHQQWLQMFETSVRESLSGELTSGPASGALAEKLKEAEEAQKVLQKDCETYKKVLAETEGSLQRLQSSVEQEETRWREKLEQSQTDLREMTQRVIALEQEVDRLSSDGDVESLRRDKQHLEAELERAEHESATYVSEVRELRDLLTELQSKLDGSYTEAVRQNEELNLLKTRLTETLCKLEMEESERQKVAGDLYKAQQSLESIQAEIIKEAGQADLIETSSLTQTEEIDRKEKMTAGLNQTVQELQELLQSVNRQLTKGNERDDGDKLYSNYKL
uniref:Kinectin 1 n=1 Tax=Cyprinus carpio TaxID=7962 RepID=A0A8C2K9B8_CYPCA